jgi:glycosyltransferase involved in cell wall biosynthesis
MKLLIFASTPPPLNGPSYMVQLLLEGLGGDRRRRPPQAPPHAGDLHGIECYHVNPRPAQRRADPGDFHGASLFRLLLGCAEAIWCRFRHGVRNFYYIPAPGQASALYRDWLVLLLCRPFFKHLVLHWQAAGLAKWLETARPMRTRVLTYRCAGQADLSIVLARGNLADAEKFLPRRIRVVSNGIPDPCPEFRPALLPRRRARSAARDLLFAGRALSAADYHETGGDPQVIKVVFLGHCMQEKGFFDAVHSVVLANRTLIEQGSPVRMKLLAAGAFVTAGERAQFDRLMADPEFDRAVAYLGPVSGDGKQRALHEGDLFCFPTYHPGDNQPVNVLEAMAFGLPVVTTRWGALAEMLPANYPGLVPIRAPETMAAAMLQLMTHETGERFRQLFLAKFTLEAHLARVAAALATVEQPNASTVDSPAPAAR